MVRTILSGAAFAMLLSACSGEAETSSGAGSETEAKAESAATPSGSGEGDEEGAEFIPYPEPVKQQFIQSCLGSGSSEEACQCLFDEFESYLTIKEFMQFETRLSLNQSTEDDAALLGEIRYTCAH